MISLARTKTPARKKPTFVLVPLHLLRVRRNSVRKNQKRDVIIGDILGECIVRKKGNRIKCCTSQLQLKHTGSLA